MSINKIQFPSDFLWGAATASYQIEGAVNEGGRGPSIWDTFSHQPGNVSNGDTGDRACDHYHLYEQDIQLMKRIGLQAYRFSVAWPRVFPSGRGKLNTDGLDFYERLVDKLLDNGIQPWLTLYHWDLPQDLQDKGGWANRDVAFWFTDYAAGVADKLGDRVKNWMTINEPWVVSYLGNKTGEHAPGIRDEKTMLAVAHHLLLGHGLACEAIRSTTADAKVGIVLNLTPMEATSGSARDHMAAEQIWERDGRWFLEPLLLGQYPERMLLEYGNHRPSIQDGDMKTIRAPLDFLGVNFYFRIVIKDGGIQHVDSSEYTEMGWEVHAPALQRLLERLKRDYKNLPPLYITENGAAFNDTVAEDGTVSDPKRLEYIRQHLYYAHEAIKSGVDLRGYFAWSLLDNFEWAFGYSKRFGITYVDYESQKRTLKQSGHWYSSAIQSGGFEIEVPESKSYDPAQNFFAAGSGSTDIFAATNGDAL